MFVATAAVADWRPADRRRPEDQEGRQRARRPTVAFTENPDILATVAQSDARHAAARCSASASPPRATTWSAHAKAKRERKGIPLLVGNIGPLTFGQDDNQLLLVDAQGVTRAAARLQAANWRASWSPRSRAACRPT